MILEAAARSALSEVISALPDPTDNRLLAALGEEDLDALHPWLRPVALTHGDTLFEPGEEIAHLHFPLSGAVSLVTLLQEGVSVESYMVGCEGLTDVSSCFASRPATSRANVQLPGEALRIEAGRLRELVRARPGLRGTLERYAGGLLLELQQTVACNASHRLEQRLAKWLLHSQDRSDGKALPLTQEFLSEMLGAQRTTVTQVASVLQRTGAIEYRRGKITILDRGLLERISCECYALVHSKETRAPLHA